MANGAVLLKWRDRNWAEQGHYIYRSDTPMDINNLPSPVATLNPNQYEYIDYDVIADQTYYYRVGAYRNNDVSVSDEIEVLATPDVFGPGPQEVIAGDMTAGFFGEVNGSELVTYADLSSMVNVNTETPYNDDSTWLKYAVDSKIYYVSKKPAAINVTFNMLYSLGIAFGTDDNGIRTPSAESPINQLVTVNINGFDFKVKLLSGSEVTPYSGSYNVRGDFNGEWDRLIVNSTNGIFATYSMSDLGINTSSNLNTSAPFGTATTSQHMHLGGVMMRGYTQVDMMGSSNDSSIKSWRPVLELIK